MGLINVIIILVSFKCEKTAENPPQGHRCPRLALRARAVAEGFAARSGEAEEEAEQTQDVSKFWSRLVQTCG